MNRLMLFLMAQATKFGKKYGNGERRNTKKDFRNFKKERCTLSYKIISPQPVIEGGTGIQSATVYAPLCGGTTTTGSFQSAATGISNSGYVLTSNGASALPSWQANGGGGSSGTFTPSL